MLTLWQSLTLFSAFVKKFPYEIFKEKVSSLEFKMYFFLLFPGLFYFKWQLHSQPSPLSSGDAELCSVKASSFLPPWFSEEERSGARVRC